MTNVTPCLDARQRQHRPLINVYSYHGRQPEQHPDGAKTRQRKGSNGGQKKKPGVNRRKNVSFVHDVRHRVLAHPDSISKSIIHCHNELASEKHLVREPAGRPASPRHRRWGRHGRSDCRARPPAHGPSSHNLGAGPDFSTGRGWHTDSTQCGQGARQVRRARRRLEGRGSSGADISKAGAGLSRPCPVSMRC